MHKTFPNLRAIPQKFRIITKLYIFQLKKTRDIRERIHGYIVRIIREQCIACEDFTADYIRRGLFLCHGYPAKTTYRSTIINPFPTTDSAQLVGIIQNWVITDPLLVLDDLLVRVNTDCPACIDALNESECEWSTEVIDSREMARISQVLSVCAVREIGEEICNL